jgi:hypothetical protein
LISICVRVEVRTRMANDQAPAANGVRMLRSLVRVARFRTTELGRAPILAGIYESRRHF